MQWNTVCCIVLLWQDRPFLLLAHHIVCKSLDYSHCCDLDTLLQHWTMESGILWMDLRFATHIGDWMASTVCVFFQHNFFLPFVSSDCSFGEFQDSVFLWQMHCPLYSLCCFDECVDLNFLVNACDFLFGQACTTLPKPQNQHCLKMVVHSHLCTFCATLCGIIHPSYPSHASEWVAVPTNADLMPTIICITFLCKSSRKWNYPLSCLTHTPSIHPSIFTCSQQCSSPLFWMAHIHVCSHLN